MKILYIIKKKYYFLLLFFFIFNIYKAKYNTEKKRRDIVYGITKNFFKTKLIGNSNNILDNIEYRVKWCLGNWYNTSYLITKNNKYYYSDYSSKPKYPNIKYIMRDTPQFLYIDNDVWWSEKCPCFTKTRPLGCKNNIIILIEFNRHWESVFNLSKRNKSFDKKKSIAFWRGTTTGWIKRPGNRFDLVTKWFNKSNKLDVGFNSICQGKTDYKKYLKSKESIKNMLKYKYLICAEGNDVSTGLKWMLYSNSVVLMPKPTIVSWFMEDHLIPFIHYVPIKDDWSDLLDMYKWCEDNQDKCKNIIENANKYVQRFINEFKSGLSGIILNEITRIYRKNIIFEI